MNGAEARTLERKSNQLQSIQEMKDNIRRMQENPYRKRIDEAGQRFLKSRQTSKTSKPVEPIDSAQVSEQQEEIQIVGCLSLAMITNDVSQK